MGVTFFVLSPPSYQLRLIGCINSFSDRKRSYNALHLKNIIGNCRISLNNSTVNWQNTFLGLSGKIIW